MKRFTLALILLPFLALPARADTMEIKVLGMVCAFCAQGIEKHFRAEPAVADVMVDLNRKLVAVLLKPDAKFDDAAATRIIEDAGYKTASVNHTDRPLDAIRAEGKN